MSDVFDRIYRTNAWNGDESRSGPGSGLTPTEAIAAELVALVAEFGIKSVLDAACGDGLWMPDLPGYLGIDVSHEAIKLARKNHPDRRYQRLPVALLTMVEAPFGLVIFRDAIQHMTLADGLAALAAVGATDSHWLLASTFVGGKNINIDTGDAYAPDLMAEPFWMGQPERLIFDGWGYQDGTLVRDPRKHLGLWNLRSQDPIDMKS